VSVANAPRACQGKGLPTTQLNPSQLMQQARENDKKILIQVD
jgi:hypothetical protein